MDVESKLFYRWLPWVLSLVVTGLFWGLMRSELVRTDADWQEFLQLKQESAQAVVQTTQQNSAEQAVFLARMVARDAAVVTILREASLIDQKGILTSERNDQLRLELNQVLQPYWSQMLVSGAKELNIHVGSGSSRVFLRVAQPKNYGDDVSQLSALLMSAIKTREPASGMEISHFGSGYRGIVPVFAQQPADNPPVIAAIEVSLPLLPTRNPSTESQWHQAVLLRTSVVNDLLWGSSRETVFANTHAATFSNSTAAGKTGLTGTTWALEAYSHPLIKDWLAKGLLPELGASSDKPLLLDDQLKSYLLSVTAPAAFSPTNIPSASSKAVILSWQNIDKDHSAYEIRRQDLIQEYILGWLLTEAVIWLLFQFTSRYIEQLLRQHSLQLQQERDQSEQARQRLTLALTSSESGFWEWNITTNESTFSKEWRLLCGLPPGEEGRTDIEDWLTLIHPSDKRVSYNEMIRHIKGETPMFESEYRLRMADGHYKWIFSRGRVVEWADDGKASLMLGVYSDITERKNNEIYVVRQQAALRALNEIASAPVLDAEDQLRRALEVGARHLGLPIGTISQTQGEGYRNTIKIGDAFDVIPTSGTSRERLFCDTTLRSADVFAVDNIAETEYAAHAAHQEHHINSYIGIPIWLRGSCYGTLSFSSERSRHQPFDDLDKDFMRLFSRWVGITLERWHHQVEQRAILERFDKLCHELPGFLYQFEMSPDGTSRFPFSSSGIESIYGVQPHEVINDASKVFNVLHPEDIGWIGQSISSSAANLTNWMATYRVLHPRQGEIWVRGLARPERLPEGKTLWHGYIQEVTEEKRAALKLQDINALRAAIFDAASISIISTNTEGLIQSFNHGAEKMLGYTAQEVIEKTSPSIFHLPEEVVKRAEKLTQEFNYEILPGFEVFIAKAREGDEDENEWTYVRKDGSHVPVILSVTALRAPDGEVTGYLGLARDISELKRIDRMKSEFISTVSHELRTPLTAISGSLGIINNGAAGEMPETAKKMLNIAHKNSLRLIHLVNDLLDMEKLVAGKMHFEMSQQLLLPIVTQSIEANAGYAAQYQVKFELRNLVGNEVRVNTDVQRLQQVLANFLSNAAKFSPTHETIDVCIEKKSNNIRVSVTDKGQGIPDAFRSRIFQKFSQADSSDTRQKGGTGLGLAICKEIIERMNGKIGFYSEEGKGAQFYFDLPSEENVTYREINPIERAQTGSRILVVEDDPEVAELFATMLRTNNYRVDVVYTGQAALERLALYSYDALTIDIHLPDMDGIELIKELRNDSSTLQLPIIVISGNLDSAKMLNHNNPIFSGIQWLQKPQSTENLVSVVETALTQQHSMDVL